MSHQQKLVHRTFGIAVGSATAQIKAPIEQFLGVIPAPIATPAGSIYLVMALVREEAEPKHKPAILLPNGMKAPSQDPDAPTFTVTLVPEGEEAPMLRVFLGAAIGPHGPLAFYV